MADIRLNVTGDAGGGVAAMNDMGAAVGKSVVSMQEFVNITKAAAKAVVDFAVDSVKKYMESERLQRQLVRAAGDYADALDSQAQALMRLNAVDDDIIKQSQILLTQWGGVGAASKKTEQAILDYAAATGQDAVSATRELIRNVESGGVGLAKLGVHFKETGDKGKDLKAAVDALGKKFGGAAAADAESLSGQTHAAVLAFEDLQKAIGGVMASVAEGSGISNWATDVMRTLKDGVEAAKALWDAGPGEGDGASIAQAAAMRDLVLKKAFTAADAPNVVTGKTNKQMKEDEAASKAALEKAREHAKDMAELSAENAKTMREYQRGIDELDEHARVRDEESYARELEADTKKVEAAVAARKKMADDYEAVRVEEEKRTAAHLENLAKLEKVADEKADKERDKEMRKREDLSRKAADAIGAAFVNALTAQLEKLAEGGEFDAAEFIGSILAATFSAVATVIGSAYGMPALGAAIGNLGSMGIMAGSKALSASGKKSKAKTYHDGGWVGAPRYHTGTWVGSDEERAILQTGERVLSRGEVGAMGGARAVDKAAKGGAARVVVNVSALDAKSAAESFETEVGRGLRRALRSGRGDMPALLGMGPR